MMKNNTKSKPLVSICTYEERQLEREANKRRSLPVTRTEFGNDVTDSVPVITRQLAAPPPMIVKKQMSLTLGSNKKVDPIPATPTPDYDFESLETFKHNDQIRSQSPYYSGSISGPPTMRKVQRPVSVTVGEYTAKKQPVKFNFINNMFDNGTNSHEDMSIRLKNELEMTLSRSNLRRRNDSVEDLTSGSSKGSSNCSSNNNSIIQINNNNEVNNKVLYEKPNIEKLSSMLATHLKFRDVNNNKIAEDDAKKTSENAQLNGILKNANSKQQNATVSHQTKNISFVDDENL